MTSQNDRLVEALEDIAAALHRLGTNRAFTGMGAIELLAKETGEGLRALAAALTEFTETVSSDLAKIKVRMSHDDS